LAYSTGTAQASYHIDIGLSTTAANSPLRFPITYIMPQGPLTRYEGHHEWSPCHARPWPPGRRREGYTGVITKHIIPSIGALKHWTQVHRAATGTYRPPNGGFVPPPFVRPISRPQVQCAARAFPATLGTE